MAIDPSSPRGKIPRAAFVLAFVKREELVSYVQAKQPIRSIANHYDRNWDTVARALEILNEHEAAIARGDVLAVARHVWRGRLGWESSDSFVTARNYIDRGELMPKEKCGRKKKGRGRASAVRPASPAPAPEHPPANINPPQPAPPPKKPAPAITDPSPVAPDRRTPGPVEEDDLLAEMASTAPLLRQAERAAAHTKQTLSS